MIDTYLEHENAVQCAEMHAEAIASDTRESVYCRYTGRKLAEIGSKPRGFDPVEMPDFDAENEQSIAIDDETKEAFHKMLLCGRGLSRSSAEIWDGED